MSVLLVSYDLHKPDKDYTPLIEALESYRQHYHFQESVWFLDTARTPAQVRDFLKNKIHERDQLFVAKLQKNWGANKADKGTAWLKDDSRTWD